jgi:hypothetical protein
VSSGTWLFTGLTLLIGAVVVAVVAYDIYLHPPDPAPVGTATIEVSGTSGIHFKGTVGTLREEHPIEGATPLKFETEYRRADYVVANLAKEEPSPGTLKVAIRVGEQTVDEGQTQRRGDKVLVMWKAPRAKP